MQTLVFTYLSSLLKVLLLTMSSVLFYYFPAAAHPEFKPDYEHFEMSSPEALLALVSKYKSRFIQNFLPGLNHGLEGLKVTGCDSLDIDWVVPHQASGLALAAYHGLFSWPEEKIIKTLEKQGNCVGASMPLALCHGIESGKVKRGDKVLFIGTGAGVSMAAMLFTY